MTDKKMGNVIGAMGLEVNNMFATPESTQDLFGHPMFQGNPDCVVAAMMTWNLIASKQKSNSKEIIDQVIDQIKEDVGMGDMTAIEELLQNVPEKSMQSYLGEDQ